MISDKSLGNQGPWPVSAGAPEGPWQWLLHLLCSCRAGRLKTLEVGTHLPLASSQVTPPPGGCEPTSGMPAFPSDVWLIGKALFHKIQKPESL